LTISVTPQLQHAFFQDFTEEIDLFLHVFHAQRHTNRPVGVFFIDPEARSPRAKEFLSKILQH